MNMDCAICIEPLFGEDKRLKLTNCGHLFHEHCIERHVKNGGTKCPSCNNRMLNRQMRPVYGTDTDQAPAKRLQRLNAIDEQVPKTSSDENPNGMSETPEHIPKQVTHSIVQKDKQVPTSVSDENENGISLLSNENLYACAELTYTDVNEIIFSHAEDKNNQSRDQNISLDLIETSAELKSEEENPVLNAKVNITVNFTSDQQENAESNDVENTLSALNTTVAKTKESVELNSEEAHPVLNAVMDTTASFKSNQEKEAESNDIENSLLFSTENDTIVKISSVQSNKSVVEKVVAVLSEKNEKSSLLSNVQSTENSVLVDKENNSSECVNVDTAISIGEQKQQQQEQPPTKRVCGPKTVKFDRRPILGLIPENMTDILARTSSRKRVSVPVARYNCGFVRCSVCGKSFYQDIAIEYYKENFACSFECFKKQL